MSTIYDLPLNELLAELLKKNAENANSYQGYIAESEKEDTILLYKDIFDLSESCEIKVNDIIHYIKAPESLLPFGGVILWLKKNSEVVFRRIENLEEPYFKDTAQPTNEETIEITAGRVVINVSGSGGRKPPPPCGIYWPKPK